MRILNFRLPMLLCLLMGCGSETIDEGKTVFGQPLPTQAAHFIVTLSPEVAGSAVGVNEYTLDLGLPSGMTVRNGRITVEPWMPDHGHGSDRAPEIIEMSDGKYHITRVVYTMPDLWQLRTQIESDESKDEIIFEIEVE